MSSFKLFDFLGHLQLQIGLTNLVYAQEKITQSFRLEQILELATRHNQSLKISQSAAMIAKQQVEIAKLQRLLNAN